jgi:hypothetical protein
LDEVSQIPVFVEGTTDLQVNLVIKKPVVNEQELRMQLKKQGITITHAKRMVKMYIINKAQGTITAKHDTTNTR